MKKTKHVVVDLETLSTQANAVVLSLAAVEFDPETGWEDDGLYHELRLDQQTNRHISIGTVQWWVGQVKEGVNADVFTNETKTPVRNALNLLAEYIQKGEHESVAIWACDPDFDCAILENLYKEYNLPVPWEYSSPKSVRTARWANKFAGTHVEFTATHNALEDCSRQIKEVVAFHKGLKRE